MIELSMSSLPSAKRRSLCGAAHDARVAVAVAGARVVITRGSHAAFSAGRTAKKGPFDAAPRATHGSAN